MVLIRVTQKLQKELSIKPIDIAPDKIPPDAFQEWYAHVFILDRKKQVIFVEKETLFSFCVPNLARKDIKGRFSEIFEKGLGKVLYVEGARGEAVSKLMEVCCGKMVFAKTENRKTIGAMNEFVKHHKYSFYYQGRTMDVQDRCNRHMPMRGFQNGSKEYQFPIDVFANMLKEQYGFDFKPHKENASHKIFSEEAHI
jgi:hypothetical protein